MTFSNLTTLPILRTIRLVRSVECILSFLRHEDSSRNQSNHESIENVVYRADSESEIEGSAVIDSGANALEDRGQASFMNARGEVIKVPDFSQDFDRAEREETLLYFAAVGKATIMAEKDKTKRQHEW